MAADPELLRLFQNLTEQVQAIKRDQESLRLVQQQHLSAAPSYLPTTPALFPPGNAGLLRSPIPSPYPLSPLSPALPSQVPAFTIAGAPETIINAAPPAKTVQRTLLVHPNGRTIVGTVEEEVITDPLTGAKRYENTTTKQYSLDGKLITPADNPRMCPKCQTGPWLLVHACTICALNMCPHCIRFRMVGTTAWREPRCSEHNSSCYDPPTPPALPPSSETK